MALTWSLEKIENYKDLCWEDDPNNEGKVKLSSLTEIMIFGCLGTGHQSITEENWTEYYARMKFQEKIIGAFLIKDYKDRFIEPEEVKAHIGLSTNATNETRAKWLKRFNQELDSFKWQANKLK